MTDKKRAKPKLDAQQRAPSKARKDKLKAASKKKLALKTKREPQPKPAKAAPVTPQDEAGPATLPPAAPYALRQVAAVPLRSTDAGLEVLLITSRETHRWVIPKGWPMRKKADPDAAATEALEEAGLRGVIHPEPIGAFSYFKRRGEHFDLVDVAVYRLDVTEQADQWPEKDQREQRWCSLTAAAALVQEPGLQALFLELAERL